MPGICLNMIVRNEAHVVAGVLDAVTRYIGSWVIVDTGSDDGTQELIREHLARLGIPGELHERPWRDAGHNRTEALALAQGHGDYIWVLDAGDTLVGMPAFTALGADVYRMRYQLGDLTCWRPRLFRDGVRVRWAGVTHADAAWDDSCVVARLQGEYHVARGRDPETVARDRDLLLAEVERNPGDAHAVFHLAQSYFELGDFVNARKWYARRVEMGGAGEQVYYAMYQIAEASSSLRAPWPDVQNAYLRAWEFRPARAEPLYAIAFRYRLDARYRLGYLYAKHAAEIPLPADHSFVREDVYAWRATDEQAVCAFWIDKHAEAFALNRRLLALPDVPDGDRQRIAGNRDVSVPTMIEAASSYPDALVRRLLAGARDGGDVAVSLVAGPDRAVAEHTLNSFLHCCTDVARVGRFLVVDGGLWGEDRGLLRERYGFLEFTDPGPGDGPGAQLARIRWRIAERFWLHLGQGWRFFAPDNFITRLTAVLEAEAQVFQVGVNFADAVRLTGACAPERAVRRAPDAGRYVLTDAVAHGPAMFDTARLDRAGGVRGADPDPIAELGARAGAAGLRTATLDEVLCIGVDEPATVLRRELTDISDEVRNVPPPPSALQYPEPYVIRLVDPDADAEMIAEWMNRPHLAQTWGYALSASQWQHYLRAQLAGSYSRPFIRSLEGRDYAYIELYRAAKDSIATLYHADPYDLGLHVARADLEFINRGISQDVWPYLAASVFDQDPRCRRIMFDPDHHNQAGRGFCESVGCVFLGERDLPNRRVALYVFPRSPEDVPRLREV